MSSEWSLFKSLGSDRSRSVRATTLAENNNKVNESFSHLLRYNYEGERVPLVQRLGNLDVIAVDAQRRCYLFYLFLKLRKIITTALSTRLTADMDVCLEQKGVT